MTFMNMTMQPVTLQIYSAHKDAYSTVVRVPLAWIIVAAVTQKTTYPPALELAYSLFNWGAAG